MAALLHRGELIFEVHSGGAGADHRLHEFEGVEHTAEAGLSVSHDGREVVDVAIVAGSDAARPLDFVGALEGVVDAFDHGRHRIHGIQGLVRIHRHVIVVVGGHLPAGQIDRADAGLHLLHRLAAGEGAEAIDVAVLIDQLPQFFRAAPGHRLFDREGAAQADHVVRRVRTGDALPAGIVCPVLGQGGDFLVPWGHGVFLCQGWG